MKTSNWSPQKGDNFMYTLKPLDEDEQFQLEYTGPPLALIDDLCNGADGDAQPVVDREKRQDQPSASTAAQRQIDENELAETTAFFSGGSHSLIHRAQVPQSQFSYNQVDEMLDQHDNSHQDGGKTEIPPRRSSHHDGGKTELP